MSIVYCSLPVSLRDRESLLMNVRSKLSDFANSSSVIKSLMFDSWSQGKQYDDCCVKKCDVFLFMHPENRFEFHLESLPVGIKKEYQQAKNLGKEIFLLYKTKDGNLCPFRVNDYSNAIKGVPGSTGELFSWLLHNQPDAVQQQKHVAQVGIQRGNSLNGYDEGYPFRIPPPPELDENVISTIDLRGYDRRLLIE